MTMKVRIEDKEALDALSWEALRAYLDQAGWRHSKDIPGKGVVYKRTGPDRRLREIAVPLRRDLADYAARMGDAVGTLARAEDRSELDVYDDLRALGSQMESPAAEGAGPPAPVVDEATRAVHKQIRTWLAEEGWDVREVDDPNSTFNVMVKLRDHHEINIYQLKDHVDHVTFHVHLVLTGEDPGEISQIPETIRRDISWDIFRDMSLMGIDFTLSNIQLGEMRFRAYAYFDGMTKDVFIHRILLVLRAVSHSIRTIARGLEGAGRPAEATSRLLRLVPSAADALIAAS